MTDRTPPHDTTAEQAVLGACLLTPAVLADVRRTLTAEDFYTPAHALVWSTIEALADAGKPHDEISTVARLTETGDIGRAGGPLGVHALVEAVPTTAHAGHYAGIVRDRARRRALIAAATRAIQRAYSDADDAETHIDAARDELTALRDTGPGEDDLSSLLTLDEFCDQPLPPEDWVIPDLLSRGDRLIFTGSEGLGKTTVTRQLAVCAAAGLHPFTLVPTSPRRVLAVDCENPLRLMVARWDDLRHAARTRGRPVPDGGLWIERRPRGMDLADRADVRWLMRRVETIRPDLLVIGPAYKLYIGGGIQREEDLARVVTSVLDQAREACGAALILEHHSPHNQGFAKHRPVRPIGSSLWLRWPEFGYGIRLADDPDADKRRMVEVVPWRGPRDERSWPERLESGLSTAGWPWVEAYPQGFRPGVAA